MDGLRNGDRKVSYMEKRAKRFTAWMAPGGLEATGAVGQSNNTRRELLAASRRNQDLGIGHQIFSVLGHSRFSPMFAPNELAGASHRAVWTGGARRRGFQRASNASMVTQ